MNLLPIELLTNIAALLAFDDRKSFALVCKRFNKSVYFKELWQSVTYVISRIQIGQIDTIFLNILSSIKLFSVNISPSQLHDIIKYSPNLTELSLIICFDLFTDAEQFSKSFSTNICEEVKETLSKLITLSVSGNSDQLNDTCLNYILAHCQQLKKIDLSELEILNINLGLVTPPSFYNSNNTSASLKWSFLDYVPAVFPCNGALSFANIIVQLMLLRKTLREIKVCSTAIEYDEIIMIMTMPGLHLTVVHLDHCKGIDSRCIQAILYHQSGSICDLSFLNTFPVSLSFLKLVMVDVPHLRTLRIKSNGVEEKVSYAMFHRPLSLTHLHLENCVLNDEFIKVINRATSITKLALLGCNFKNVKETCFVLQRLLELDLSRSYGFSFPGFLSSIFALSTIRILLLNSIKITNDDFDLSYLKELLVLSIVGCTGLTGIHVATCLQSSKHLKVLRLQRVQQIDDEFFTNIHHLAASLQELDISNSTVSDKSLIQFLAEARKLRRLRVDDCNNITNEFIKRLPTLCPYLQDVSMRNCDYIDNPITLNFYERKFLSQL